MVASCRKFNTRGVFAGGGASGYTNTIEFITIATTGNGQDFGDLTVDANRGYQDSSNMRYNKRYIFWWIYWFKCSKQYN